jgi:hypothetical protein
VKRFIRNKKSKAFLTQDGSWTTDVEEAIVFQNDEQVRQARDAYHLKYCELYYCFRATPSKLDFAFSLARWVKSTRISQQAKTSAKATRPPGLSLSRRRVPIKLRE